MKIQVCYLQNNVMISESRIKFCLKILFQALKCREARTIALGMSFNLVVASKRRKSSVAVGYNKPANPWYDLSKSLY